MILPGYLAALLLLGVFGQAGNVGILIGAALAFLTAAGLVFVAAAGAAALAQSLVRGPLPEASFVARRTALGFSAGALSLLLIPLLVDPLTGGWLGRTREGNDLAAAIAIVVVVAASSAATWVSSGRASAGTR
jgi:hypothetical protein